MESDSIDRMVAEWARREPERDVSPLHVVGRLLRCAAHGERVLVDALRPLGLSYGDFDVLNTLRRRDDPAGTHPRVLATSSLITSGAMTARLDRLDAAGLVTRHPDPDDRRGVLVRLTARGAEVAERALTVVLAADEEFIAALDAPTRESLATGLRRLLVRVEGR